MVSPLPVHLQDNCTILLKYKSGHVTLLKTLLAPTELQVTLIGLQSSGPRGPSLNSPASTLCLAHWALATLASLFLGKARQIPASDFTLVSPDTYLHTGSLVSFVFAPLSLG